MTRPADANKAGAARRNRALRKILNSQHLPIEIRQAITTIINLLNPKSNYAVAWPSAATIGKRMGKKRRTGQWYVRVIKGLGIFRCQQMPPEEAMAYCEARYGFAPKLDRCVKYGPNLFEPNLEHPLWDTSRELPGSIDKEMGRIARSILRRRNARTTSKLASDAQRRPGSENRTSAIHSSQESEVPASRYCVEAIRQHLREAVARSSNDVANPAILAMRNGKK
jgi:hypothetical protein